MHDDDDDAQHGDHTPANRTWGLGVQRTYMLFFPAVNWLTSGFGYATLSLNWLTCRLQTIAKNLPSERASNSDTRQRNVY